MPDNRRTWTEEDIAKLKALAGKLALRDIATQLGRTPGATAAEASKLKVSLRTHPYLGRRGRANSDAFLERSARRGV